VSWQYNVFSKHLLTVSAVFIAIFLMVATINTQPILSPASAAPPPGRGPSCPTGFAFNFSTGQCEASACPIGTSYDASTNKCVDGPACPTGSTLQGNQCETTTITSSTPLCRADQSYGGAFEEHGTEGFCGQREEIAPGVFVTVFIPTTCSSGFLDPNTGLCEITTTITSTNQCPSGYTATGTGQGTCTASPIGRCPTGSTQNGGVCQTNPIPKGPKQT
jgi:hypothetical protein